MTETPLLTRDDFEADPQGHLYLPALDFFPDARDRLFEIFNGPYTSIHLTDAEYLGHPALAGVSRFIEAARELAPVFDPDASEAQRRAGMQFRRAIGKGTLLAMTKLGWRPTGRKGAIVGAKWFTKAERFEPPRDGASGPE